MDETVKFTWKVTCTRTPLIASTTSVRLPFVSSVLGDCEIDLAQNKPQADEPSELLFTLSFQFDAAYTDEQLRDATNDVLEKVLTTLTFREHIIFDSPIEIGDNLADTRLSHERRLNPTGNIVRLLGIKSKARVGTPSIHRQFAPDKTRLTRYLRVALRTPEEPLLRAYRSALEAHDASAEFIIHYAILAAIYGDRQSVIDDKIDPNKKQRSPSPKNPDGETKFTRVRNELAHPKGRKRPLHKVLDDAATLRSPIRELARQHLLKHLRLLP